MATKHSDPTQKELVMGTSNAAICRLSELSDGDKADVFVLMTAKEDLTTRDGKPYCMVAFRDAAREVRFPIWAESKLSIECRDEWRAGNFYKIRGVYQESSYGPQMIINEIREVTDADSADGFDPSLCIPASRFDPEEMMRELLDILKGNIADEPLRNLCIQIIEDNREVFLICPAARSNHHAFRSGLLEHVLSVTKTSLFLADKYVTYYETLTPPLNTDVVIAGATLHDIGKLREYDLVIEGVEYSPAGNLIGHILQGRDMVREHPAAAEVDAELLLRLEHVIVAHQRLPEWGSPKPPMTPEALIVHYADDLDAKYAMMAAALSEAVGDDAMTSNRNPLRQRIFRGAKPH